MMFELQTFLSLGEWAVKLLDYRNKRQKAFFEEVVKPCYVAAKDVRDDLVSIYIEVEQALQEDKALPEIERIMLANRENKLSTRDALRAQLRHIPPSQFTKFEQAIVSLLEGKHTHALMRLHVDVRMSLQYITKMQQRGASPEAVASIKADVLNSAKQARQIAEEAWREIAEGYAEYISKHLHHPA